MLSYTLRSDARPGDTALWRAMFSDAITVHALFRSAWASSVTHNAVVPGIVLRRA